MNPHPPPPSDVLRKLIGYAGHRPNCASLHPGEVFCTCGLGPALLQCERILSAPVSQGSGGSSTFALVTLLHELIDGTKRRESQNAAGMALMREGLQRCLMMLRQEAPATPAGAGRVEAWVSVDSAMPEMETVVLIAQTFPGHSYNVQTAFLRMHEGELGWHGHSVYWHKQRRVTHWMPLPAPPIVAELGGQQ